MTHTHTLLALFTLIVMSSFAMAADPGLKYPPTSELSDTKAGSLLFYNIYTSNATASSEQNTRINITNTNPTVPAFVHLFFVAEGCSVADSFICLSPAQTAWFLVSDVDPGVTGYLVAIATDGATGGPAGFNWLIGDEYVKFSTGHFANLGAESFAALFDGLMPGVDANTVTAAIRFNGVVGSGYNRTPAVLALDNIPSRNDNNSTIVILNRVGGNLGIGASTLGTLFGVLYNDTANSLSFNFSGSCQFRAELTSSFPRTAPRFDKFIAAGRSGWAKFFSQTGTTGILGCSINFNPNSATNEHAFSGGHNLHVLTLSDQETYIIPVFRAHC